MTVVLKNNAFGFLQSSISNSATSISLQSGYGANFPSLTSGEYFYATFADTAGAYEIVKCTARSGDVLTVTRAQEGTTAQSFAAGSRVELRVTAQSVIDAIDDRVAQVDQAVDISIADAGNYYSSTDVEGALQEAALSATTRFTQAGSGAVTRSVQAKLREVISVADYGALGNGTNDDTAAIQAAITYALSRPNAEVYFPPCQPSQFYKTTAPLVITGPVSLRGDGPNAVQIIASGLTGSQYIIDYDCLAANVVEQVYIKGLTLRTLTASASALRLKNVSYVTVKDVRVYSVVYGVIIEGTRCFSNTFEQLNSYQVSADTIRFVGGFTGGGHFTFLHCTFTGNNGFTVLPTAGTDSLTLVGCNFEQCVVNSLYIGGSVRGLSILGCRTEGCNSDDFQINPASGDNVEGITITGTSFTTDAGASKPIILGGAGGTVRGFSITGNQVEYAGAGTSFVFLNGDGESGLVAGNYFAQNNTTPTNAQRAGVIVFGNENSAGKCAEYWGSADWGVAQGTWVPVDASGAGLAITGSGRYTKIGRQVFWQAYFAYPATADGTNASIGGLPYVIGGLGGNTEGRTGATVQVSNYGADVGLLQGIASTTSFSFYSQSTATNLTNANLTGKYFYCSGMYTLTT